MKKTVSIYFLLATVCLGLTEQEERFLSSYIGIGNSFKNWYVVSKFGHNEAVGTSLEPLTLSGNYQTPTSAQALEVVSSSANDDLVGTGAQKVTVYGLDGNWELQEEEVEMDGTTAVDLSNTWTRVFRMRVSQTGTYATQSAGSHAGTITLRADGAGATWAIIDLQENFPTSTTQIGVYSVPTGWRAFIFSKKITFDSNQASNVYFFYRSEADQNPSGPMVLLEQDDSLIEPFDRTLVVPMGPFIGPCDVGFMAAADAGTADISIDFELIVYQE